MHTWIVTYREGGAAGHEKKVFIEGYYSNKYEAQHKFFSDYGNVHFIVSIVMYK